MSGKIFVNYRRGDEPGFAGRLFDRLEGAFSSEQLFMDVDNIAPGRDFVRELQTQVDECDVLLAIIGPDWLDAHDDQGRRRLENHDDFVRIEIESGLNLGKRVIPVLVNNTQMPRPEMLPDTMKPLARRNAVRLTHDRFRADAQGLIKVLQAALAEAEVARREAADGKARDAQRNQEEEAARANEAAQIEKDQTRLKAMAGLSILDIAKAEELANWEFIKTRGDTQELRNHLARFPDGVAQRFARTALEELVWAGLGATPDLRQLDEFLVEFPDGAWAAAAKIARDQQAAESEAKRIAEEQKRRESEAWAAASASRDLSTLNAFLEEWPKSRNAKSARAQIRELKNGGSRFSRRTLLIVGSVLSVVVGYSLLSFDLATDRSVGGSSMARYSGSNTFACMGRCGIDPLCAAFEIDLTHFNCTLYSNVKLV